jgi:DNA polymerase III subunit epsilon
MEKLVIDTETTGLFPNSNQLLTLGMVLIDVDKPKLKFIQEKHILVKHDHYNISRTAMKINSIDIHEHEKTALPIPNAILSINDFIDDLGLNNTPILGHNVHFDQRFITSLFNEQDEEYPFHQEKEDTRYIWERLKREGKISPHKNAKLGTIANHFGIDYSKAHDAIADCKITAQVYHKMINI